MTQLPAISDTVLSVRDASVEFAGGRKVVDGVSFDLHCGETLALVGESGSGKTLLSLAILGLLPEAAAVYGKFLFDGRDLTSLSDAERRNIRGGRIAAVFQDPLTSLNPYLTIGRQMTEMTRLHLGLNRDSARRLAVEMLRSVGIPDAERRVHDHPHEFSGGMRQRVAIAMALSCKPDVLIADEPTTALDVTIQAQILDLLSEMKQEAGVSVIVITHDLSIVGERADRVVVLYSGCVMEDAPASELFRQSANPYTIALLKSLAEPIEGEALYQIPGAPPMPGPPLTACAFAPRCPRAEQICTAMRPPLKRVGEGHFSRCHFADDFGGDR